MSQENVEIVRRVVEEFQAGMARGDPGAAFDTAPIADDYEHILEVNELEGRSVWRGRKEFVKFMRTWTEELDDWSIRVERLIDAGGDRVVALMGVSATGKGSGVPVELNLGQVYELEAGRVARVRNYPSHTDALEAAGLQE